MLYTWVTAKSGVVRSFFTEQQKGGAYCPPDHVWTSIAEIAEIPAITYVSDPSWPAPRPTTRWVVADGVVTVEPIP